MADTYNPQPDWLVLLNDHLDETGHEIATDDELGAYCATCAEKES